MKYLPNDLRDAVEDVRPESPRSDATERLLDVAAEYKDQAGQSPRT